MMKIQFEIPEAELKSASEKSEDAVLSLVAESVIKAIAPIAIPVAKAIGSKDLDGIELQFFATANYSKRKDGKTDMFGNIGQTAFVLANGDGSKVKMYAMPGTRMIMRSQAHEIGTLQPSRPQADRKGLKSQRQERIPGRHADRR